MTKDNNIDEISDSTDIDSNAQGFFERTNDQDRNSLVIYIEDLQKETLLDAKEEKKLAYKVRSGDELARSQMVQKNLRLVVKIAKGYIHRGVEIEDLIEEGNIGLMKAVDKFNPDFGYRFSTYATWWIRQSIEKAIMNNSRTVRLPVHVLKKVTKCNKVLKQLQQEGMVLVKPKDIEKKLKFSIKEIERLLMFNESSISIDDISISADNSLGQHFSKNEDINLIIYEKEIRRMLFKWIKDLPDIQRKVITYYYGLYGSQTLTLVDIASVLGINREQVRKHQRRALRSLKSACYSSGILNSGYDTYH